MEHKAPQPNHDPMEKAEKTEIETTPSLVQQAPEVVLPTEEEKATTEEARLEKIEDIRKDLGIQPEKPKETGNEEITTPEEISMGFKLLAASLDELSQTIRRNKFPRVNFNIDALQGIGSRENFRGSVISKELEELLMLLSRITFPDNTREKMALEPQNYRSIIIAMEAVMVRISRLKTEFQNSKNLPVKDIPETLGKAQSRVSQKIEVFSNGLNLLRRMKDR